MGTQGRRRLSGTGRGASVSLTEGPSRYCSTAPAAGERKPVLQGDAMRKIRIIEHISLDGVIQAPSGPNEDPGYPPVADENQDFVEQPR
jgi:hypothetical protein